MLIDEIFKLIETDKVSGYDVVVGENSDGQKFYTTSNKSNTKHKLYIPDDLEHVGSDLSNCYGYNVLSRAIVLFRGNLEIIGGRNLKTFGSIFSNSLLDSVDMTKCDISSMESFARLFIESNIKEIKFGKLNSSKVNDMANMFNGCKLDKLDISGLSMDSVVDISNMFSDAKVDEINIGSQNTGNLVGMWWAFSGLNTKKLDLSGLNTCNLKVVHGAFYKSVIDELDLSNFNIENVYDDSDAFRLANIGTVRLKGCSVDTCSRIIRLLNDANNVKEVII